MLVNFDFWLEEEDKRLLKKAARQTGKSMSRIMREYIDKKISKVKDGLGFVSLR